ncbi:TraR/DksA family transcriptional regulator [Elioraea sp.]|uniref:TraR/DksA family transcriptional regulator n=1 Tax=Elioraea sp. TaxID=2185103 RepID=UPI003F6FEE2E
MHNEEAIRTRLVAERAVLEQVSQGAAELRAPVDLDQQSVGRLSRMDSLQVQAMALATEERRRQQIARIDAALKRLDEGTYGDCVICGEAIAPKRLEFDPAVPTCINCAARTG